MSEEVILREDPIVKSGEPSATLALPCREAKVHKDDGPGRVSPGRANPPVARSGQPDTRTAGCAGPPRRAQADRRLALEVVPDEEGGDIRLVVGDGGPHPV